MYLVVFWSELDGWRGQKDGRRLDVVSSVSLLKRSERGGRGNFLAMRHDVAEGEGKRGGRGSRGEAPGSKG